MPERSPLLLRLFLTALAVFAADYGSKLYIKSKMAIYDEIVVIPRVFSITHIENPGAAFGMLANQRWLFIVVTIVVIGLVVAYARQLAGTKSAAIYALGMMLGGAIGNFLDRLRTGLVTDFLEIKGFPVFNVADSFITIGVGLFILLMWRETPGDAAPDA